MNGWNLLTCNNLKTTTYFVLYFFGLPLKENVNVYTLYNLESLRCALKIVCINILLIKVSTRCLTALVETNHTDASFP